MRAAGGLLIGLSAVLIVLAFLFAVMQAGSYGHAAALLGLLQYGCLFSAPAFFLGGCVLYAGGTINQSIAALAESSRTVGSAPQIEIKETVHPQSGVTTYRVADRVFVDRTAAEQFATGQEPPQVKLSRADIKVTINPQSGASTFHVGGRSFISRAAAEQFIEEGRDS